MLCLSVYLCVWESVHFVRVCVCSHLSNSVHVAPLWILGSASVWLLYVCVTVDQGPPCPSLLVGAEGHVPQGQ